MNRPAPGPQSLRGMPAFSNQQPPQSRPLGASRLTNGKMGSGSWGFGIPNTMGGAPGLQHPQSRQNSGALGNFAQTISGSQPATPLDLSEFPSLSGQPQQSHQNSAQSTWANPTQRSNHTPVQRPQQNSNIGQGGGGSQAQLGQGSQQQGHNDDLFPSSSQFANGLDDYRFGGQNAVGQLTGSSQPQTTNIEEFPPLGRSGNGEIGQDRREGMMQQNGFGGPSNGNEYGQHMTLQGRNNILRAMSGSTLVGSNGNRQANVGGGAGVVSPVGFGTSGLPSRSPTEPPGQGRQALNMEDAANMLRSNPQSLFSSMQGQNQATGISQMSSRPGFPSHQQSQQRPAQPQSSHIGDFVESPRPVPSPDSLPYSEMAPIDRFGLKGLLASIRHESPDIGALAVGQDLTQLGLDLNQPENNPLYPNFGTPFESTESRPVEPEYTIPDCYSVPSAVDVANKIPSFSDETLFYMFYSMPKDVNQELAANELTQRNWRYHKFQKQWLTKDTMAEPVRISANEERGYYIFFDTNSWQRTRREFLLQYDALDSRAITTAQPHFDI